MVPSPGHKCVSLSRLLSCRCVERMCAFSSRSAAVTPSPRCAWPTSRHTPMSRKCPADRMFERPRTPRVFAFAQVKDEKPEGNLLGNLKCPLHLIHRVDAAALFRMDDI